MSLQARVMATAIAATVLTAIAGTAVLVACLGGNWLAFVAAVFVLLVVCAVAVVLLAFVSSAMEISREMPADDPDMPRASQETNRWAS